MEMSKAITSGSATALSLVKTILTTPLLYEEGDFINAIPLEVESYSQNASAQVSESLVITANESDTDGLKRYMADNVAPSGWTWQLQGYIAGLSILEPTNFFPWVVIARRELLRQKFSQGKRLIFKDIECKKHTVVIENIDLQWQNDCRNKQPVSLTLKEINVMSINPTENSTTEKSTSEKGSSDGAETNNGITSNSKIEKDSEAFTGADKLTGGQLSANYK